MNRALVFWLVGLIGLALLLTGGFLAIFEQREETITSGPGAEALVNPHLAMERFLG